MISRRRTGFFLLCIFSCVLSAGAVVLPAQNAYPNFYECPYSGPTDDDILTFEVTHYILDVTLEFPGESHEGMISGTVEAECVALTDDLNQVNFDFLDLDTAEVVNVQSEGSDLSFNSIDYEIVIDLPETVDTGETFFVTISYTTEGLRHFQFRPKGDEQYAFNTMVENSRWFPSLHDPRDKATYDVNVRVDSEKTAAVNGELVGTVDHGDGTMTYMYEEHQPMASYLLTINVAEYVSIERSFGSIPIVYYVTADKVDEAEIDFENDTEILTFFSTRFGDYPFENLGMAQVPIGGAMENQDMISYGSMLITGDKKYEDTFAHEISHMWWGDSVTLTGCEDVWLNEGFASYCEYLWEEYFYGDTAAQDVLNTFRETYFNEDESRRYAIYDPDVVWSATTYKKAAWVLHMLRWVVGDDNFWSILPEYYETYKFSNAVSDDFQAVCEANYGEELDWFFEQWIYQPGYPEFELAHKYDVEASKLMVRVEQIQENAPEIYSMPVEISWETGEKTQETQLVWLENRVDLFEFDVESEPASVEFDAGNQILCKYQWEEFPRDTGVRIEMPSDYFRQGDTCYCKVTVTNASASDIEGYPLFVILDVYGELFFAPSFADFDHYGNLYDSFPPGDTLIDVLPEFIWPAGTGTADGIKWYAALTTPEIDAIFGTFDSITFGWGF